MTPEQFRDLEARLGLNDQTMARLLGVTDRTVRRYTSGSAPIPEPVSRLLRLMLIMRLAPDQVLSLLREERDTRTRKDAS